LVSRIADGTSRILIPFSQGLAGAVATTGEVINIADVYEDPRFNASVDKNTGYRTKSLMTIPVRDQLGQIIAVAQLMNKLTGEPFSASDVELTSALCMFTGIALANSNVIEAALVAGRQIQNLLEITCLVSSDLSLSQIIREAVSRAKGSLSAESDVLFFRNKRHPKTFSSVGALKSTIELGEGLVGAIAESGRPMNVPNATEDQQLETSDTLEMALKTRSILGAPIRGAQVHGVVLFVNKDMSLNAGVFTMDDERVASNVGIMLGIAMDRKLNEDPTFELKVLNKKSLIVDAQGFESP
jgi:GAF domain-containing protein